MNAVKILGLLLIAAGLLALMFGGFRYTNRTRRAKLGAVELSFKNKRKVSIPMWAGVAAVAAGVVLILLPG